MMLHIHNDPAGVTGSSSHELDRSITIHENLVRHLETGADCVITINDELIDPLTDARIDQAPNDGDVVCVTRRPGYEAIAYVAAWIYEYAAVIAAVAAVAAAAYASGIDAPMGDASAGGKDSPNNRLTGQSNVARAYQAIPDVYGVRRVWPDLIQASTVEYVDQIKLVTEWLCVSRGTGDLTNIRYADTPISDIDGASYEVFQPAAGDGYAEDRLTTISDVYETYASQEVNGQELPYPAAWAQFNEAATVAIEFDDPGSTITVVGTDGPAWANMKSIAGTGVCYFACPALAYLPGGGIACDVVSYVVSSPNVTFVLSTTAAEAEVDEPTTAPTACYFTPVGYDQITVGPYTLPTVGDQLWWHINFLRGLQGAVQIRAEWWQIDDDGDEIGGTRQDQAYTYTAAKFDARYYTEKVIPSGGSGRYRIEFKRITNQVGTSGNDVAKLEELYAVRYYEEKELPGVTVIRVTTKATLSATGFSDRKFNAIFARHIRTLDSEAISASRNFARVLAHMWCIAGNDIAELDTDRLAEINAEHGEASPLLRFDGSLDDADMSLGERMQLVAWHARCTIWRDGTQWTAIREQQKSYPEMQLDYRNLARNGSSSLSYASHLPASNDGVELEYVDETTQQKRAYIRYRIVNGEPISGRSGKPKKVQMMACTTQEQANNRALLECRRLIYQRDSVQDSGLEDSASLGIGSLVRWIDPNDFGGDGLQAGEVMTISGYEITTSEPLDWRGETTGRMLFTRDDGRLIDGAVTVTKTSAGAMLAVIPEGLYTADSDRQLGSRYAFGVGLSNAEIESAGLYVVQENKPSGDGVVSLSLVNYDSRMFAGD